MEQENNKDEVDIQENAAEASEKAQSSENKNPTSLRPRSKIAKSMAKRFLKTKKGRDSPETLRLLRKNEKMIVSEGSKETENKGHAAEKLNSEKENQQNNATSGKSDKNQQTEKNLGNAHVSDDSKQQQNVEENPRGVDTNQKGKEKHGDEKVRPSRNGKEVSNSKENRKDRKKRDDRENVEENLRGDDKNQKSNEKRGDEKERRSRNGKEVSEKNRKDRQKCDDREKRDHEKKEKLGGLIFMCSSKTKPDCFHYRVMGVSTKKKGLVLGVRPGLKLFLYDFDLKLMYGVYKAASSGGMKLEPKAFGGAFPVQVRFNIHSDCYPLPESIFKKAIKENYDEKNKFKIELTPKQVTKLTHLFRPVALHSTALLVQSAPSSTLRIPEHSESRRVFDGRRELNAHLERESARHYAVLSRERDQEFARRQFPEHSESRGVLSGRRELEPRSERESVRHYAVLSRERDEEFAHRQFVSTKREEIPNSLYPSENEYRTLGLRGERTNLTRQHYLNPFSDYYQRDYNKEQLLRMPDPIHRESVRTDPLYSVHPTATAYRSDAAALDSNARDTYHAYHYGSSSFDAYLPPPRRENYIAERDRLRGSDHLDRYYTRHSTDDLSDYNRTHHYRDANLGAASMSVSSRYSFPGLTLPYR